MAKRGPKPKPTALKLLHGTRPSRVNGDEPAVTKGLPEPPAHLDKAARDEWDRIAPMFDRMGVLTEVDGAALALYCDSYSRWLRARMELAKRGMVIETAGGGVKLNPAATVITASIRAMRDILAEFGGTPSARSTLRVGAGAKPAADAKWEGMIG